MSRRQSFVVLVLSAFLSFLVLSISIIVTQPVDDLMPTLAYLDNVAPTATIEQFVQPPLVQNTRTDNQFIVQYEDSAARVAVEDILVDLDGTIVADIPQIQGAVIAFENEVDPQQLETLSSAVLIEPNYTVQSLLTFPTNDPMLDRQWAWKQLDVPRLWNATDQQAEVIVAVIDSGVCFNHPDLQGRFLSNGFDFVDNDNDPSDMMGHGCAISGIIAANLDNGVGIAGMAPNTKILPLRVLDAQGIGTYANVMSAIHYAVDNGADIINLSLGGQNHSQLLEQAVNYAVSNGVHVVAGSGNTGQQGVLYPAKYDTVIAIGSHDQNGNRSSFSTYGDEVDTLAPGEEILTTALNGEYKYFTGTSMAAPHVSALLALSNAPVQAVDLDDMMSTPVPTMTATQIAVALAEGTSTPTPTLIYPTMTNTPTEGEGECANYTQTYTLGSVRSDIAEDLQWAVACANVSSEDNTIELNNQHIILENYHWGYSGFNSVRPIENISTGGTLTIQNGVIERASHLTCPAEGTSTGSVYFRFFLVKDGGDLTLNNIMLSNGCSNNANLNQSIRNDENGGAIYNLGKLTINNSTLHNNMAYHYGGAIYNEGLLTINNSTIYNNQSTDEGGAIYSTYSGQVTINQSTISSNSSTTSVGGLYFQSGGSGTYTLANSIVADNIETDCDGVTTLSDVNLIEDSSCDASANGQLTGDPLLDPNGLQDNGGITQTIALVDGSPAIDAGQNSVIPTDITNDQRGAGYPRIVNTYVDLGAYELSAIECPDSMTYVIPDGDTAGLIDAINASEGAACGGIPNIIELASNGEYVFEELIPINVNSTVQQRTALPIISKSLQIIGNGATLRRADNAPSGRIITIIQNENETIYIENLRIMNGYQAGEPNNAGFRGHGGGISISARSTDTVHTVTLDSIVFENNNADSIGAALVIEGDPVIVRNSAFINNGIAPRVEAVYNDNYATENIFENNIFYANGAEGIVDAGRSIFRYNTLWNNYSRGFYVSGNNSETTITGNILGEAGDRSCYTGGRITSLGYNLGSDNYCTTVLDGVGDLTEVPSGISALVYTSDSIVPVLALNNDSLALDAIPAQDCSITTDIVGTTRPQDSNNDSIAACNIGAFENLTTDFIVEKTASQTIIDHGDIVDFTISITNNGGRDASGVVVADVLPTNLRYISSTATQGEYDLSRELWIVDNLGVGETQILTLTATVYLPLETNNTTNTAQFAGASVLDTDGDYSDLVEITINCPATGFNIADGDVTGLISAIIIANNDFCSPGADTIYLATDGEYIFDNIYEELNALPQITSEITIEGNGATITRDLSATDMRFIEVMPSGTLTLQNMTMSEGYLPNYPSGAISSFGELILTNVHLLNNTSRGGGALYQTGATLTIDNSVFDGNRVATSATGTPYRIGGALGISDSIVSITNSTFSDNQISYNTSSPSGGGGALSSFKSDLYLQNVNFNDNSAPSGYGGAIYIDSEYEEYQVTIDSSTFTDNSARGAGGAIYATEAEATVTNSLFLRNESTLSAGGAVYINRAILRNLIFAENRGWEYGAVSANVIVEGSHLTIVNNHTSRTITGAIANGSNKNIKNSILLNNTGGRGNCSLKFGETGGYNISDDDSCTFSFDDPTDQNNADIELYPLGYYGYSRQSILPKSTNLIDVIPAEVCNVPNDYHGNTRPTGGACDIGAVEITNSELYPPYDLYIDEGDFGDVWTMTWQNDVEVDGYQLQYVPPFINVSATSTEENIELNSDADSYLIDTSSLSCDASHNYLIRSYRGETYSEWSNTETFYLPCSPQPAPTDFSGQAISLSEIELTWTPVTILTPISSVSGTTWYEETLPVDIEQYNPTTDSWAMHQPYNYGDSVILSGFSCEFNYQFRLRVNVYEKVSNYTDPLQVNMPLCPLYAPNDLAYEMNIYDDVILTWTDNNDYEDNYVIERSLDGNNWSILASLESNTTTYTDDTLESETTYHYRVRAYYVYTNRYSGYSNVITFTTGEAKQFGPVFTVNIMDDRDAVCLENSCSLREAIAANNLYDKLDSIIKFDLPGNQPYVLMLSTSFEVITNPVVIDGWSQAGWVDKPIIRIDTEGATAFRVAADDTTIRGFSLTGNSRAISAEDADNLTIVGNYIGVDLDGITAIPNGEGIYTYRSNGYAIGGLLPYERNVISGNITNGLYLRAPGTIQNNIIGLNATGTVAIPNGQHGIKIEIQYVKVGGTEPNEGNIISGNGWYGIYASSDTTIQGNYVGTDISGSVAIPNGDGIYVTSSNLIGGNTENARNIISGNLGNGIRIEGTATIVKNNFIGVDATGQNALPNNVGIFSNATSTVNIFAWIENNIISGNASHGVWLKGQSNTILGNLIGEGISGTSLGNGGHGIYLGDVDSLYNDIGSSDPVEQNIIANNGQQGVALLGQARFGINLISNNGGLGIDLQDDELANVNDIPDVDGLLNYPNIESITADSGQVYITATLNAQPDTTYTTYLYMNSSCDLSGTGEGEVYLTSETVQTDLQGHAPIYMVISGTFDSSDEFSMQTVDSFHKLSSEYSPCMTINPASYLHAPSNLQASNITTTSVDLSWQDNSADETAFIIDQLISGTWTEIDSVISNSTSTSLNSLSCKTSYTYRVRAYRLGDDTYSIGNTISIQTNSCPPLSDPDIYVTVTEDVVDGICDAHCSLREAVNLANSVEGIQTIHVPSGEYRLVHAGNIYSDGEDANIGGDIDIWDDVRILGAGQELITIIGGYDRIFHVHPNVSFYVEGMTLYDGKTADNPTNPDDSGKGGAIANWGHAVVEDIVFTFNLSYTSNGDQIYNGTSGIMHVNNSHFLGLSSAYRRKLPFYNEGYLEVSRSLIELSRGILFAHENSTTIMTNVIASKNTHFQSEALVYIMNDASVVVNNSTFVQNIGRYLFYTWQANSNLTINNSIIMHSQYTNNRPCSTPYGSTVHMTGMNILSSDECDQNSNAPYRMIVDPYLITNSNLNEYVPRYDSPAIDAAIGECPATDYYGNSRPIGDACDIGAVESPFIPLQPPTNLTGTVINHTHVNLSWQNHTSYEAHYRVERSTDNINWTAIADVSTDSDVYSDTSTACFTDYYYRVSSVYGAPVPSESIQITTGCEPLVAPTSFTANLVGSNVNLSWGDDNQTETQYTILRRISGVSEWETLQIAPTDTITYSDTTVTCETSYEYQVEVYRSVDNSSLDSTIASLTTAICPVSAPTSFTSSAVTDTTISLSWVDTADNESGFFLYDVANPATPIAILPPNTQTHTLTDLVCNTDYELYIQAYRQAQSTQSLSSFAQLNTATSRCAVKPPANPSPMTVERNSVEISWQDSSPNETTHIVIERALDTTVGEIVAQSLVLDWDIVATLPASLISYYDNNLICGSTYWYRLRGYDQNYNEYSDYSDSIQVITSECPVPVTNTIGVYHEGRWAFRDGVDENSPITTFLFGPQVAGWIPLTGDWDGDGVDGIGIYKNGVFALRDLSEQGVNDYIYLFGNREPGWQPIVGDWNGDGADTVGLYRNGMFMLTNSNQSPTVDYQFIFGQRESGWIAIAGDWNRYGRDFVGLYKDGKFQLHNSFKNQSSGKLFGFGSGDGWTPVAGDWDADGISTIGLYKDNNWRLRNTNNSGSVDVGFSLNYFNGEGYPLASYRGGEEAIEALAFFTSTRDIDVQSVTDVSTKPTETAIPTEPIGVTVAVSTTQVEATPTISVSATNVEIEPTIISTPTIEITVTHETSSTVEATATAILPSPTMEATMVIPTQNLEAEVTDEVSGG